MPIRLRRCLPFCLVLSLAVRKQTHPHPSTAKPSQPNPTHSSRRPLTLLPPFPPFPFHFLGPTTHSKAEGTRKAVSATSIYFESLPYRVHPETGLIDYDQLETNAALFKPAMIIGGGSAYPRDWDYARLRQIADANGALLMIDMAHISGLVATQEVRVRGHGRGRVCCLHGHVLLDPWALVSGRHGSARLASVGALETGWAGSGAGSMGGGSDHPHHHHRPHPSTSHARRPTTRSSTRTW
jgi:hypothetical protein